MKKYSTKTYYNYARRMLEGEAALAVDDTMLVKPESTDLVATGTVKPIDSQFKGLVLSASGGAIGALACIKYLDKVFAISDLKTLAARINGMGSDYLSNINSNMSGFAIQFRVIVERCTSAISKALEWVYSFFYTKKYMFFEKPNSILTKTIGSSKYTYGTVLSIAVAGALIGGILYKVYKIIRRMIDSKITAESYYNTQINNVKKTINESLTVIKKLSTLTEGDTSEDALIAKAEAIIDKNEPAINETWTWADLIPSRKMVIGLAAVASWIIAIIALCKCGIACWNGIKETI